MVSFTSKFSLPFLLYLHTLSSPPHTNSVFFNNANLHLSKTFIAANETILLSSFVEVRPLSIQCWVNWGQGHQWLVYNAISNVPLQLNKTRTHLRSRTLSCLSLSLRSSRLLLLKWPLFSSLCLSLRPSSSADDDRVLSLLFFSLYCFSYTGDFDLDFWPLEVSGYFSCRWTGLLDLLRLCFLDFCVHMNRCIKPCVQTQKKNKMSFENTSSVTDLSLFLRQSNASVKSGGCKGWKADRWVNCWKTYYLQFFTTKFPLSHCQIFRSAVIKYFSELFFYKQI